MGVGSPQRSHIQVEVVGTGSDLMGFAAFPPFPEDLTLARQGRPELGSREALTSSEDRETTVGHLRTFSQQHLIGIVAAASSIDERLVKAFLRGDPHTNGVTRVRLGAWCQAVAQGDWHQFRQRLEWDSLEEGIAQSVLGVVRLPEGLPLPGWADTLDQAVRQAAREPVEAAGPSQAYAECLSFLDAKHPLPFEELLAPFVLLARRRCAAQAGEAYHFLSEEAHVSLE